MSKNFEEGDAKVYAISGSVTFDDVADYVDALWADLRSEGSATNKRAVAHGVEIAALPSEIDDCISIKKSAAGLDHSVVDFVVMLAGTEAAKVVGRGVVKASTQLWDHVILPQIRSKYGDGALKEKAHEEGSEK